MPSPPLLTVHSGTTEWGRIATGGDLGYDSDIAANRVVAGLGESFDEVLSAHAKSDVTIMLHEYASVKGFITASSCGNLCNPVLFTVDFNSLGLAWQPLDGTETLVLAPGRYRLRCRSRNGIDGLHSAWGFRQMPSLPPSPLAILTVGRYPLEELDWILMDLTRSVTRFGRLARVCDAGAPMGSWLLSKVERVLAVVRDLPNHITHVLFCDGSDCAVLGTEKELIAQFQSLEVEFAISMERICWPVSNDREWKNLFPKVHGGRRFPNSGMWMGTRSGTETVLAECLRIYYEVREARLPSSLQRWGKLSEYADDDQWIFQMALLAGRVPIHLDFRYDLFANIGPDCRLLENNPDYDVTEGRLRSLAHHTHPLVVHFAGKCTGRAEWQARLGTLRGPARPRCEPAGAEADPYRKFGTRKTGYK